MGKSRKKEKESPTLALPDETRQYLLEDAIRQRITDADFIKLSALPINLDYDEWLATHVISFFNHTNLMYGVISEYCSVSGCPSMTGPGSVQYLWFDEKGKKCKCPAPQYVDYVTSFIQKTINEDSVFPTKFDKVFPSSFEMIVKKMHRFLFHVFAHIYHVHYREVLILGLHGHLNSLFLHFMTFNLTFDLLEDKEAEVLHDLLTALMKVPSQDRNQNEALPRDQNDHSPTEENLPQPPPEAYHEDPPACNGDIEPEVSHIVPETLVARETVAMENGADPVIDTQPETINNDEGAIVEQERL